ncbi:hypothetical protein M3Y99_00902400 [Aphelenchoides fujianensis]|nr:hypothetical protein M3Y99_00902400 [Aphelenchoides fujianensis]
MPDYQPLLKHRKRRECKQTDGFSEAAIVAANSDMLPKSEWSGNFTSGLCEGAHVPKCLPGFVRLKEGPRIYTAPAIRLGSCTVRKSMSRVMKSLVCLLNDPLGFLLAGRDLIADALDQSFGRCEKRLRSLLQAERKGWTNEAGWRFVMVVREPVERFLSGWLHQCVMGTLGNCEHKCLGCGPNMTCFLQRVTRRLHEMAATGDFVGGETNHVMPQTWFV